MDPTSLFTPAALAVLAEVVMIDLVLAGDNAVVVGTIAAGLPKAQQKKVVFVGVAAALVLRIVFALAATQLLQVIGLLFAGGLLLLWVAWKMWRELPAHDAHATESDNAPRDKIGRASCRDSGGEAEEITGGAGSL